MLLVGSGRMGRIRAKAAFSNPRFEIAGVVDQNVNGAKQLADLYRVRSYSYFMMYICAREQLLTFLSIEIVYRQIISLLSMKQSNITQRNQLTA